MELQSVKKLEEIALDGITITGEVIDRKMSRLFLTDRNGRTLNITGKWDELQLAIPKKQQVFTVKGELLGLPIEQPFFDKAEAIQFISTKESQVRVDTDISLLIEETFQ